MNTFLTDFSIYSVKENFLCVPRWLMYVFPPLILISVVLLDTTSVLGELGWKTYPINGVRGEPLSHVISFIITVYCCITEINYIDLKRTKLVE